MQIELTIDELIVLAEYHADKARRTGGDSTEEGRAHWKRNDELWSAKRDRMVELKGTHS